MSGKPPVFKQTTEDSVFYKKVVKPLDAVMKSDNDHKKRHDAIENAFKQFNDASDGSIVNSSIKGISKYFEETKKVLL